jgi:hypothetical protein
LSLAFWHISVTFCGMSLFKYLNFVWIWTQDLMLAREVLYHLSHTSSSLLTLLCWAGSSSWSLRSCGLCIL